MNKVQFRLFHNLKGITSCFDLLCDKCNGLLITTDGMIRRGVVREVVSHFDCLKLLTVTVGQNPDLDEVDNLIKRSKQSTPRYIIALGGGSVLDTGKAMALLLSSENQHLTLSQVLREEAAFFNGRLPFVCIPTTSGTGAEVTPFGTIWDHKESRKRSLSSSCLTPDVVVLEPRLTLTANMDLTINCALDTCSHALESLWNKNATDQSIRYALSALKAFNLAFPVLQADLLDLSARRLMQHASFLAGLAIAISRTAIAHSISYPLTLHYGVPHGLACSFSLLKIFKEVERRGAWALGTDKSVVYGTVRNLEKVGLDQRINRYCSFHERMILIDEMFTPGRGDNFTLDEYDLRSFL